MSIENKNVKLSEEVREKLNELITNDKIKELTTKDTFAIKLAKGVESGVLFIYRYNFEVVTGDVISIPIKTETTQWGSYEHYLLYPLNIGTIIKETIYEQQDGKIQEEVYYHIFTGVWETVRVK